MGGGAGKREWKGNRKGGSGTGVKREGQAEEGHKVRHRRPNK